MNDLLTVTEFAKAMKVSGETVRRWAHSGTIKAIVIGRTIRIPATELPHPIRQAVPREQPKATAVQAPLAQLMWKGKP